MIQPAAGIEAAPGKVIPSASAALVGRRSAHRHVVAGRASDAASTSSHSSSVASTQLGPVFPRVRRYRAARHASSCSMGPAGTKIAGMFMLAAAMIRQAWVLSQPPIRTAPSTGWLQVLPPPSPAYCDRASSKVLQRARKAHRWQLIGKPPACKTPRLTSSTCCLKCAWH